MSGKWRSRSRFAYTGIAYLALLALLSASSLASTAMAAGDTASGGITLSRDMVQLIIAAAIAVIIAAMVIYFFRNMSTNPEENKKAKKPVEITLDSPKSPKPDPQKRQDDVSTDYIYELVTGKPEMGEERPLARAQNEYKKKR